MHDESNTITELRIAGQLKRIQVQPQGLGANFPAYEVNPRGPLGLASEPDPNGNAGVGRRIWSIFRF